jgi:hypothetical protein
MIFCAGENSLAEADAIASGLDFQERKNKDFRNDQTFSCRHVYRHCSQRAQLP